MGSWCLFGHYHEESWPTCSAFPPQTERTLSKRQQVPELLKTYFPKVSIYPLMHPIFQYSRVPI